MNYSTVSCTESGSQKKKRQIIFLFWRWLLIKGKSRLVSSCPPVCPALAVCFPIVSALFLRFRCPMFSVVRPILACLPSLCFSAARPFSFCPPSLSLLSRPASSAQRFPSVSISQDFHTVSTAPVCPLASIAPGFPYSELRSCLSTREHCSELSTHSGFHSVSSAPVFPLASVASRAEARSAGRLLRRHQPFLNSRLPPC